MRRDSDWLARATAIRPEPPVDPRSVIAVHPHTPLDSVTVLNVIGLRTAEARALADCPEADGWWYEPSRTPADVRLAIWKSVLRAVRGHDPAFTPDEVAAIVADPRRHGRRVRGNDVYGQ